MEARLAMKGNLHIIKGMVKQKYARFTDDKLLFVEGKGTEFFGRLEKKLGRAKNNVKRLMKKLPF